MCLRATDASEVRKMRILKAETDVSCTISTRQARHMLALAFFLALPDGDEEGRLLGSLKFHLIYAHPGAEGIERTKCLLNYFYHEAKGTYPETEEITYERRTLPESERVDWSKSTKTLNEAKFSQMHRIEDMESGAEGIVDFANKRLQIFQMIESCTQEEVMFSCRPVLKLSMLICPMLGEEEVALMRGARPYSEYTGYLNTFKFLGDSPYLIQYGKEIKTRGGGGKGGGGVAEEKSGGEVEGRSAEILLPPPEVIAIDAVVNHGMKQFKRRSLNRDLNKAWLGFGGGSRQKPREEDEFPDIIIHRNNEEMMALTPPIPI
mmetsp:Transcript_40270/g.64710  ORF Transcript_40270/g.64710 Transcript_40270/m.64710 type:complete len:320 (+) Transcript_40270:525-1484(+)